MDSPYLLYLTTMCNRSDLCYCFNLSFYSPSGAQIKSDGKYPSKLVGRAVGKILIKL